MVSTIASVAFTHGLFDVAVRVRVMKPEEISAALGV
jgi:hypothetical protein